MNPLFYSLCRVAGRVLAFTLADVRVSGLDRVPRRGPLLIVCNHLNNVDPILLASYFPRPVYALTKVELTSIPVIGTLADWYGAIPVRRGEFDRGAIEASLAHLRAGKAVLVFPEGTRSKTGALQEPKAGLSLLASRSGAPILPVAVYGSEKARGLPIVWEHPRITIRLGEPVSLPIQRGRHGHRAFTHDVMRRIAALLPPEYQGDYAGATVPEWVAEFDRPAVTAAD